MALDRVEQRVGGPPPPGGRLYVDSPDFGHLGPLTTHPSASSSRSVEARPPEVVVADAGYWHQAQMENIVSRGMKVLAPSDSRKRKGARPG